MADEHQDFVSAIVESPHRLKQGGLAEGVSGGTFYQP